LSRKRLIKIALGACLCWAVVSTFSIVTLGLGTVSDHKALDRSSQALDRSSQALAAASQANVAQGKAITSIQMAALRSCHRSNIAQVSTNRSNLASWRYNELFISLVRAGLKHQTGNVKRNKQQRQATRRFIRRLQAATDALTWIPLADCPASVYANEPPPGPVSFGRVLPPHGALVLGNRN